MNRRGAAMILALSLATSGCSHVADRLTPADVRLWRPGVTTEGELVDALGPPADRAFLPDGHVLLRWRGAIGVSSEQRRTYGFVVTRGGVLVRRASSAEMHPPPL